MDSIEIPERYFCPNPLDGLTEEDFRGPAFQYYLERGAVEIDPKEGKAQWLKRSKNCFLQMYSLRFVKPRPGEQDLELDQICGRIIFDVYKVFQRKRGDDNRYAINKNGFARLIGPMGPVDACCHILLYPRLYRANRPGDLFHPDNLEGYQNKYLKEGPKRCFDDLPDNDYVGIGGKFILEPEYRFKKPSDELITEELETPVGTVRYKYAIFKDAIDSFVTIKLLEWYGKDEPAPFVYGRISACNTRLPEAKSTIFHRNRDEAVLVSPGQFVPIDRPVNIVSVGHWLNLSVRITHRKNVSASRNDDLEVATADISIAAECVTYGRGEDGIIETKEILGRLGKFEVKFYFLPCWSKALYDVERDDDEW